MCLSEGCTGCFLSKGGHPVGRQLRWGGGALGRFRCPANTSRRWTLIGLSVARMAKAVAAFVCVAPAASAPQLDARPPAFPAPQGQFAFVLFDGEKRQVFAARDSSGSEPLYYCLDEDGAVSLSNTTPRVPTDDGAVQVGRGSRARGQLQWMWPAWVATLAVGRGQNCMPAAVLVTAPLCPALL